MPLWHVFLIAKMLYTKKHFFLNQSFFFKNTLQKGKHMKRICHNCGMGDSATKKIIKVKNDLYLCNDCIEYFYNYNTKLFEEEIEEDIKENTNFSLKEYPTPRQIYENLNKHVVGQDIAKKKI